MLLGRLKEWREAKGYTQQELGREAGIAETTVARLEIGWQTTPRTARKLARTLGVSVEDLLENPPARVPKVEAPAVA